MSKIESGIAQITNHSEAISKESLDRIDRDISQAVGLPNHAYTDEGFFHSEKKKLFATTWTCIGNACDVPSPGDLKPVSFLGAPLLLCRGEDLQVRVFHNVCSHRGNELVWQAGNVKVAITCPYHAWCYSLTGELLATPHIGGKSIHSLDGLDKTKHGLKQACSVVWMDLVFVNLSEDAAPFEEHIAPLITRIDQLATKAQFDTLKPAKSHGKLTIEFKGNWKLAIENNLDAYHLPWVHPDLNSISKFEDHYDYVVDDLFAGQGSSNYDHSLIEGMNLPVLDYWPEKIAEYPTLFPNVFFGFHCDHFWTRVVEPIATNKTLDHLQIYYFGDAADSNDFETARQTRLKVWEKVFKEDIGVVEGMQRGRNSPAFDGGLFSSALDRPSHSFTRWVAKKMSV
ncbi:MAG: choline monooxygenase [Parasphingorhabdus sp.]|jgi:choline monooxygenase